LVIIKFFLELYGVLNNNQKVSAGFIVVRDDATSVYKLGDFK